MYKVLERGWTKGCPEIISVTPLDVSGLFFGEPMPQPLRPIVVKVNTITRPRNIWWAASYLVVDLKWVAALVEVGETHFELFPATFVDRQGKRDDTSFRFINLLNNVDCMDMRLSKYEVDEDGFVDRISRLVVDESRIPQNRHLFRVKESETIILVSDVLFRRIRGVVDRGAKFTRIEDFDLR